MEPPLSEVEQALRAIIPTASPSQLMDAVVEHAVAASNSAGSTRRRRRSTRRHGAYVRLRELEQSRQYNLRLDVIDLKRQIAELAQLRQLLGSRTLNRKDDNNGGSLLRIASVYYEVMARGYQEVVVTDTAHRRIDTKAYLECAMSEDVAIGRFVGRQNFLPMMKRYTTYFSPSELTLTSAVVLPTDPSQPHNVVAVRTIGEYFAWLTPHTIRALFPHVVDYPWLVNALLSRPLRGSSRFDFLFDTSTSKIVRFDADMNFLPAFMELIPDPAVLGFLFSQAKISEEMFIGDLDEFEATATPPGSPGYDETELHGGEESDSDAVSVSPSLSSYSETGTNSRSMKIADLLSGDSDDTHDASRQPAVALQLDHWR